MKKSLSYVFNWQVILAAGLLAASALVYYFHYLVFHDLHHILLYLIGDIAFVFIEVLLVTIILHQILEMREKRSLLKKLNMVIGAFFSEAGTELLRLFGAFDRNWERIGHELKIRSDWSAGQFRQVADSLKRYACDIRCQNNGLLELKKFLLERRQFLLGLLENPNLLEHRSFTDLLWAVFHLTEELAYRKDLGALPPADLQHLAGDIKRVEERLLAEWLAYMKHLQVNYPYLFSLAMRTNPFDATAQVVIP